MTIGSRILLIVVGTISVVNISSQLLQLWVVLAITSIPFVQLLYYLQCSMMISALLYSLEVLGLLFFVGATKGLKDRAGVPPLLPCCWLDDVKIESNSRLFLFDQLRP
jgi:hypothetical protein